MALLVAGAGYVGTALAVLRRDRGERVYGLRRNLESLPSQVEPVRADLTDRASLEAAVPRDVDAVAYTAAADGSDPEAYRRAYVRGLEALLDVLAARGQPVRRVVFTSSTGVYGDTDGGWVDETSPTEPTRETGRILLEAERALRAGPFSAVAIRLAGIYGPGRTRLIDQVRRGEAPRGSGDRWTNRIHRDDCAGAIDHLLDLDAVDPIYVGVDHAPARMSEVRGWLADRLGVAPPDGPTPVGGPGGEGRGKRCRNDRLVAAGYRFRFPSFREGYGAMIDAMAEEPT